MTTKKYEVKDQDKEILNYKAEGFAEKEIAVMIGKKQTFVRDRLTAMRKEYKARNTTHLILITLKKVI